MFSSSLQILVVRGFLLGADGGPDLVSSVGTLPLALRCSDAPSLAVDCPYPRVSPQSLYLLPIMRGFFIPGCILFSDIWPLAV